MKKSLLALAVLGGFAGVASAQSSVTLYGTIDLSGKYVKNEGSAKRLSLDNSGINSSQLGFRGVEDLGGGLKASFVLLSGINADVGTANAKFWNRRATVSLSGGFGEVRLGRDYTPTFWNNTNFDAFGTNGLGDSSHVSQLDQFVGTWVRADNSVGYFLPSNIGGVYGQFMAAASETTTNGLTGNNPGRYIGGRVGFAAGPFDVAAAAAQQRIAGNTTVSAFSAPTADKRYNVFNLGGSYDFGVLKLLGHASRSTLNDIPVGGASLDLKETRFSLSTVVPLGQGEIHAGYERSKLTNNIGFASNTAKQFALGYVYNLSKRTALYTTASILKNDDGFSPLAGTTVSATGAVTGLGSSLSVAGGTSQTAAPTLGGNSKGFEVGIRHFF
ncbi:MAG TPA: porin [Burkholderiaceae bacterium]